MLRTRQLVIAVAGVGLLTATFLGGGLILGESAPSAATSFQPRELGDSASAPILSLAEITQSGDEETVFDQALQEADAPESQVSLDDETVSTVTPSDPCLTPNLPDQGLPPHPPACYPETNDQGPPADYDPEVTVDDDGGVLEEPPLPDAFPEVSSIDPEDGMKGVPADARIKIIFSEPMDKLSTESAFSISTGTPGSFVWTSNYMGVHFVPASPLPYGEVVDVEVSTDAKSALGLPMEDTYSISFMVVQQSVVQIVSTGELDGFVFRPGLKTPADSVNNLSDDIHISNGARGFLSFDLSELPEDLGDIQRAELSIFQVKASSKAYQGTGNLMIRSWLYGALDPSDYGGDIFCLICGKQEIAISTDATVGLKTADVTNLVKLDWENRDDRSYRSQYRLRFAKDEGSMPAAGVIITAGIPTGSGGLSGYPYPVLEITYTHP